MTTSKLFFDSVIEHRFWRDVLGFPEGGRNQFLPTVVAGGTQIQKDFLQIVGETYDAWSKTAPQAYRRVYELSADAEAKKTAKFLYDVEMGAYPLVKSSPLQGCPHDKQFILMIESLVDGMKVVLPSPETVPMLQRLSFSSASLTRAIAACDVLEHLALGMVRSLQEFLAQWQVLTSRKAQMINRHFLDEHSLTEGQSSEQHLGLLGRLLGGHPEVVQTPEYETEKTFYLRELRIHLDGAYDQLKELRTIAVKSVTPAPPQLSSVC